jgi:carbonic anhydrase
MKIHLVRTCLAIAGMVAATTGCQLLPSTVAGKPGQDAPVHWSYAGKTGPEHWGEADPKFTMCASGRNQSPVDIATTVKADLEPLRFDYAAGSAVSIHNNGHTIQVDYAPGSTLSIDGKAFGLTQFHFHSPSENTINGRHFPMEAHFVHADALGNLAVVAVMFEEGATSSALAAFWSVLPGKAGERRTAPTGASAAALLPADRSYFRFTGSLTTPPCSEGVRWLVLRSPMSVSRPQVDQFISALHEPNNRPVQPLNARVILR